MLDNIIFAHFTEEHQGEASCHEIISVSQSDPDLEKHKIELFRMSSSVDLPKAVANIPACFTANIIFFRAMI